MTNTNDAVCAKKERKKEEEEEEEEKAENKHTKSEISSRVFNN
jgi:hypothetical protein